MGGCMNCCDKQASFEEHANHLEKVVSASYVPPDENEVSISKKESQMQSERDMDQIDHTQPISPSSITSNPTKNTSSEADINSIKLTPINTDTNSHSHVQLTKGNINLNHYSPFPSASRFTADYKQKKSKQHPLQSMDLLSLQSHSNPVGPMPTIEFDKNSDQNVDIRMIDGKDAESDSENELEIDPETPTSNPKVDDIIADSKSTQNNPYHDEYKVSIYTKQVDYASGAFAHVFISENDGKKVAIKKIDIDLKGDNIYNKWSGKTSLKEGESELDILKHLKGHKNIINLNDNFYESTVYDDCYLYLIMDFMESSLDKEIMKYGNNGEVLPNDLIKIYSFQILAGLKWMKDKDVIHRDLKPENILIDPVKNVIKICDFGCSKIWSDNKDKLMENYVCSRYYRAPELILESGHYDFSIDLWSFGCILGEMYLGQILFDGADTIDQLNVIIKVLGKPSKDDVFVMNDEYEYETLLDKFECDSCDDGKERDWKFLFIGIDGITDDMIQLLDNVLVYNPNKRWDAEESMKCEYFDGLMKDEEVLKKWNVDKDVISI